jgi:hypothetical protein
MWLRLCEDGPVSCSLKMTVEKGEHGSKGMRNGLGQTIPLVQMDGIGEIL